MELFVQLDECSQHRRARSSASATASSVGWSATKLATRLSKVFGVVLPSFKPNPRSVPRSPISMS